MIENSRAKMILEKFEFVAVSRMSRPETVTQEELMTTIRMLCEAMRLFVERGVEAPE